MSWLSAVSAFSFSAFQLLPKCGLGWLCPAIPHSALRIPHSPQGVFGWPCPGFQGSRFRVQGSKFGVCHKLPKYNPPLPPPSGWSGGGLVPPWTNPGTIDPAPAPLHDQAHLSNAVSSGVSALSPYSALDVGCWMLEVRRSPSWTVSSIASRLKQWMRSRRAVEG